MAYVVMAYIAMADIVMAYVVMADIIMVYIARAYIAMDTYTSMCICRRVMCTGMSMGMR